MFIDDVLDVASEVTSWSWTADNRIVGYFVRGGNIDLTSEFECHDIVYLQGQVKLIESQLVDFIERLVGLRGNEKRLLERAIRDKEQKLEYINNRLSELSSSQSPQPYTLDLLFPSPSNQVDQSFLQDSDSLLSEEELLLREKLEIKVQRSFYEAGQALKVLRDRRLYRSTHKTFEQYCFDKFGFARRRPYSLIDAAEVFDNLLAYRDGNEKLDVLPTNECHLRPLVSLQPEEQCAVWKEAVVEAGGKVPTGRIVSDIVRRTILPQKQDNLYRVGEICQIVAKDNLELRGKTGSWCIVTALSGVECNVVTWDKLYIVSIDNLKSFGYGEQESDFIKALYNRIALILSSGDGVLELALVNILRQLGQIQRPYLTVFEDNLLNFIEQLYCNR